LRKIDIKDDDLPNQTQKGDLKIKSTPLSTPTDDEPARLELSLTKKEKADLIKNAKKMYALKPSALIRMLLKEKGVI
jgi:hypothetical protein